MNPEEISIIGQITPNGIREREKVRARGTTRGMGVDKAITPHPRVTIFHRGEGISNSQDITHNPRHTHRPKVIKEGVTIKVRDTSRERDTTRVRGTNKVREPKGIKLTTKEIKREVKEKVRVRGKGVVRVLVRAQIHHPHHPQAGQGEVLGQMSPPPPIPLNNREAGATWDGDLLVQAVIPR